jgi:hypothetical protein
MAAGVTDILAASNGELNQTNKDGGQRQKEKQRKDEACHSEVSTASNLLWFQNLLRTRKHLQTYLFLYCPM